MINDVDCAVGDTPCLTPEPAAVEGFLLDEAEVIARIVDRATARRPQDRYPSVAALGADLVSFLRGGASFPVRRVSRGELIIKEGEAGDAAYIIINGRCEAFTQQEGQRVSLQLLGPGDVFGELALLLEIGRASCRERVSSPV